MLFLRRFEGFRRFDWRNDAGYRFEFGFGFEPQCFDVINDVGNFLKIKMNTRVCNRILTHEVFIRFNSEFRFYFSVSLKDFAKRSTRISESYKTSQENRFKFKKATIVK